MRLWLTLIFAMLLTGCAAPSEPVANSAAAPLDERAANLSRKKSALERFFRPMRVREGDWLESHPEDGETFEEYVRSQPTLPTSERRTIYIQPVGKFSPDQKKVIRQVSDYMGAFYNLPVVLQDQRSIDGVPKEMVRVQYPDNLQIRTTYFLDDLLPKLLPADAAALICLTSNDLFPDDTWNFVFGQASLERRVGVWSLWRLERDNGKRASRDLILARTLKIAMHETGHMFSMRHCTKYECVMSGTNHLDETDRYPIDTCPECSAKVAWAMNYPLEDRYKRLADFWQKLGRLSEHRQMLEKADALCDCRPPKS
jgi:archaemetzincin